MCRLTMALWVFFILIWTCFKTHTYSQNAFIDMVVTHMPDMKQFELVVPFHAGFRGARCGSRMVSDQANDLSRLMDWVPKYQPPASCQILLNHQLVDNSDCKSDSVRVFVGIRNARRSPLQYCL